MTIAQLLKKMDQTSGLRINPSMRKKGHNASIKGKKGLNSSMKRAIQKEKLDLSQIKKDLCQGPR